MFIPEYLRALAFRGLVCVHTHFLYKIACTRISGAQITNGPFSQSMFARKFVFSPNLFQENLLGVLKQGELLAFVGSDVDNRLWVGELTRDAEPDDQHFHVTWLKVNKIQRDVVYLVKDRKAGLSQITRDSCLGSISAYLTSARNRVAFRESDWNQLVALAVREGIALSNSSNVGATELPTLTTHVQTPINAALITLSAKNISPDNQLLIFSSHCARIQPVVDQVECLVFSI